MPKVILAGYNLDSDIIRSFDEMLRIIHQPDFFNNLNSGDQSYLEKLKKYIAHSPQSNMLTPETISAAYARISRYPEAVPALRKAAREEVDKARKSNENIIFGLGHSSVAEHATFNFDVLELSRLGVEFLERFRLASFTEKSQRYITLDGDYVIPEEIKGTELESLFVETVQQQNEAYFTLLRKLTDYLKVKHADLWKTRQGQRTVEGWAKEDARYAISLSIQSQLGMTVNARTLEHMISRARSHPLMEIQKLGELLYHSVHNLAPSIVKYPEPTPYFEQLERLYSGLSFQSDNQHVQQHEDIVWLNADQFTETDVYRYFQFVLGYDPSYTDIKASRKAILQLLSSSNAWDAVPRPFEFVYFDFIITLSSAAFGQLKRHRMTTQITQPYQPDLGITIPPSIKEIGAVDILENVCSQSEETFNKIKKQYPLAAPYILTNAHRRRVLLRMNLRELYHFCRLRSDKHAQWDIRNISSQIASMIRNKFPELGLLLVGKDKFNEAKKTFTEGDLFHE
ncbi:MAG: hypothetical protein Kow00108_05240 [Calditrichia bacterium]